GRWREVIENPGSERCGSPSPISIRHDRRTGPSRGIPAIRRWSTLEFSALDRSRLIPANFETPMEIRVLPRSVMLASWVVVGFSLPHHYGSTGQRGLKFEWFDGENFETKVGQRTEYKISTAMGEGVAGPCGKRDHFSCRWTGYIHAPTPGAYQLR